MITLFENGITGNYFLKVDMDYDGDDDYLGTFDIVSVVLIESMQNGSTHMNIKFVDVLGQIMNEYPIIPDSTFYITFGRSKETAKYAEFKLSSLKIVSTNTTDTGRVLFSADFIHNGWENLIKKTKSRSWTQTRHSAIAKEIAGELGITDIEVEQTNEPRDVIQPEWTNSNFLKWLAKNSVNTAGLGGYTYFLTLSNKFIFKTFDSLYDQEPALDIDHVTIAEEGKIPFNYFTVDNNYVPTLVSGGFGVDYMYFDFEQGQFVSDKEYIDDSQQRQISDWSFIADSHNDGSRILYGGRNTFTSDVAQNKLLMSANSVEKSEIRIAGGEDVEVGNIVNIKQPVSKYQEMNRNTINEVYSGHWLVWKMSHVFDIKNKNYTNEVFLARNGINGKAIDKLVKTQAGKVIK